MARSRGKAGEDYAAALLESEGYQIIGRNVHSRYGEVDVIAADGQYICFVEVKSRRRAAMVDGVRAVTPSKQKKIITTALLFLQEHSEYTQQPRFDVVSVETDGRGNILGHQYIKGAFDGEAYG